MRRIISEREMESGDEHAVLKEASTENLDCREIFDRPLIYCLFSF